MRRPTKTALALTLATCAALGAFAGPSSAAPNGSDDGALTFSRAGASGDDTVTATAGSPRIWFVVRNDTVQRLPLDADGDGEYTEDDIPDVDVSLPGDAAGRLALLQEAGVATDAATLEEAIASLELPFMFAGREQWVLNLTSVDGAAADPRLWNVSMESPVHEANSMRLLLGRAIWSLEERGTMADDVAYWNSLVPEWAPRVRDQLAARGIPFSVELLASPGLELFEAAKPLFPKNSAPTSLHQLGVDQAGEGTLLRSMSAEQLMSEIWPLYYRYHHRPAGSPVPEDLQPGLMLGQIDSVSCDGGDGCINGIRIRRSPVTNTDAYKRWVAYGMPGDPEHNGYVVDDGIGWAYSPLLNKFWKVHEGMGDPFNLQRKMWLEVFQSGEIKSEYLPNMPWVDVAFSFLKSRIAVAGFLGAPEIWFAGPYEAYAPGNTDAATLERYRVMVAGG